jgi:hypothetical protein
LGEPDVRRFAKKPGLGIEPFAAPALWRFTSGERMRLFDVYLAVDWSARSKPSPERESANAVWVGERVIHADLGITSSSETYFRTRSDCRTTLRCWLLEHMTNGRRVLIGFDFGYGYPAGFAAALGLTGGTPPWRLVWNELSSLIEDNGDNSNNRFAAVGALNHRVGGELPGPFWGCPARVDLPGVLCTGSTYPYRAASGHELPQKRRTETHLPGTQPTWKLSGVGSVGSQTLLGIPTLAALRDDPDLRRVSRVWPFETGFGLEPVPSGTPTIVHAEIWPRVVDGKLDPLLAIKDQAEVRAMVEWLSSLDMDGELLPLFQRPQALSVQAAKVAVEEEGWILGA